MLQQSFVRTPMASHAVKLVFMDPIESINYHVLN